MQILYSICTRVRVGVGQIRSGVDRKKHERIAEYIKDQLKDDQLEEQLTMSEVSPFTGGK